MQLMAAGETEAQCGTSRLPIAPQPAPASSLATTERGQKPEQHLASSRPPRLYFASDHVDLRLDSGRRFTEAAAEGNSASGASTQ